MNTKELTDEELTAEFIAELHNEAVDFYCAFDYSYTQIRSAAGSGLLVNNIYTRFLEDGPLDGVGTLPTPGQMQSLFPADADTFIAQFDLSNFETLLQGAVTNGYLSAESCSTMVDLVEIVAASTETIVDITADIVDLQDSVDATASVTEMAIVGVFTGSYLYWTGQWGGSPAEEPVADHWLIWGADAAGAVAGAGLGGLGSGLGAIACSWAMEETLAGNI